MSFQLLKTLLLGTLLSMNSCSAEASKSDETIKNTNTEMNTDEKLSKGALSKDSKKLVVFFSHTGENYNVGNIEKGNNHIIADMIADASGADIFEIVPEKDYPHNDYNECIVIAKKVENFPSLPYILTCLPSVRQDDPVRPMKSPTLPNY